jgi:hypothetical protein
MAVMTPTRLLAKKVCFRSLSWLPLAHAALLGSAILVADIADTRTHIEALGLDKKIPVGNSDAGSYFADDVLAVIDYGVSERAMRG